MKGILHKIYRFLANCGFDLKKTSYAIRGFIGFINDYIEFNRQGKKFSVKFSQGTLYPCFDDRFKQGGTARGHYFHQDLLVARRIYFNNPVLHVDVGSRVDGFVAHVASFRQIEVIDIRPMQAEVHSIRFIQSDLMKPIETKFIDYCDSLSCLHALEHFGLGRYGDKINYEGYLHGLYNIAQMIKKGGKFYFSVPIGKQQVQFNAHRIFSVGFVLGLLEEHFVLDRFSFVDDSGALHENVSVNIENAEMSFGCEYGCGIFELTKC